MRYLSLCRADDKSIPNTASCFLCWTPNTASALLANIVFVSQSNFSGLLQQKYQGHVKLLTIPTNAHIYLFWYYVTLKHMFNC